MRLGWMEIVLIVVVLLLLFGPKRLPDLGRSLGSAIRGFKKGVGGTEETEEPEKLPPAQPTDPKGKA